MPYNDHVEAHQAALSYGLADKTTTLQMRVYWGKHPEVPKIALGWKEDRHHPPKGNNHRPQPAYQTLFSIVHHQILKVVSNGTRH